MVPTRIGIFRILFGWSRWNIKSVACDTIERHNFIRSLRNDSSILSDMLHKILLQIRPKLALSDLVPIYDGLEFIFWICLTYEGKNCYLYVHVKKHHVKKKWQKILHDTAYNGGPDGAWSYRRWLEGARDSWRVRSGGPLQLWRPMAVAKTEGGFRGWQQAQRLKGVVRVFSDNIFEETSSILFEWGEIVSGYFSQMWVQILPFQILLSV